MDDVDLVRSITARGRVEPQPQSDSKMDSDVTRMRLARSSNPKNDK
jgi:hypothetical protein